MLFKENVYDAHNGQRLITIAHLSSGELKNTVNPDQPASSEFQKLAISRFTTCYFVIVGTVAYWLSSSSPADYRQNMMDGPLIIILISNCILDLPCLEG